MQKDSSKHWRTTSQLRQMPRCAILLECVPEGSLKGAQARVQRDEGEEGRETEAELLPGEMPVRSGRCAAMSAPR